MATIRQMTADDYDAVVEVWRTAALQFCPEGRESREAVLRQIAAFPALSLVAVEEGRVAGVVLGTHDTRKGWVNRLAVLPDFRRQGIAGALIDRLQAELDAIGIEVVAALVKEDNNASITLCKSFGYEHMDNVLYFSKRKRCDV